jgi:hypothetical protein
MAAMQLTPAPIPSSSFQVSSSWHPDMKKRSHA